MQTERSMRRNSCQAEARHNFKESECIYPIRINLNGLKMLLFFTFQLTLAPILSVAVSLLVLRLESLKAEHSDTHTHSQRSGLRHKIHTHLILAKKFIFIKFDLECIMSTEAAEWLKY